jgi:RNA polymerase sigma-70 factor (ECF subfamily)
MNQIDQVKSPVPKRSLSVQARREALETTSDIQRGLDPSKWLDRHGDYLFRYALVRVHDAGVAEDLLQETLLAAVGACESHDGRSSERTWLVGILKDKIIDYFRRVARHPEFQLMPEGEEDGTEWFEKSGPWCGHWREDRAPTSWPIHTLESHEFWEIFEHCLAKLPQQMSIAFSLREIDDLTSTEICEILNVTPNYLWVLLHRSRAKLRQLLEAEWFHKCTPPPLNQKSSKSPAAEESVETHLSYRTAAA